MNLESVSGRSVLTAAESGLTTLAGERAGDDAPAATSFKNVLQGMIDNVASLQKEADGTIRELVAGEGVDLHTVAVRMNEAEVAFGLMMEVRNKLLDAYRDVMKMQP